MDFSEQKHMFTSVLEFDHNPLTVAFKNAILLRQKDLLYSLNL